MKKKVTEAQKKYIVNAINDGADIQTIATDLGLSNQAVSYWVKQLVADYGCKCKSCIYGDYTGVCNYLLITGEMRIAKTHGNKGCDKFVEGEKLECKYDFDFNARFSYQNCYSQSTHDW